MSKKDKKNKALAEEDKAAFLALLKRFFDDFLLLYFRSSRKLHDLFEKINNMHPIKFTMSHPTRDDEPLKDRCDCDAMTSIPFLDTLCSIIEGRIDTDLFRKETDRNQ